MLLPVIIPYGRILFILLSYLFMLSFNYIRNSYYNFKKLNVFILTTLTMIFGIIGTIILYNIENPEKFFSIGTSLYGAIIFIPVFFMFIKLIYKRFKYLDILNFIAPTILVVIAIMRINCTLSGCCRGIEFEFGIKYENITRFPVQPIEALLDLIAFAFSYLNERKSIFVVNNYFLLIIVYPIIRLICELFRDEKKVFIGLSTGQIISIILLIIGVVLLIVSLMNKRKLKDKHY